MSAADMAQERLLKPAWQFDVMPPWLPASNLSSYCSLANWAVFQSLVLCDHAQMAMDERTGRIIRVSHAELAVRAGCSESAVRKALPWLLEHRFLDYYHHGRSQHASSICVDTGLLREVYAYVCPLLPRGQQGWRGRDRSDIPDVGVIIYGKPRCQPLVVCEWTEVQAWVMRARQQAGAAFEGLSTIPDPVEIRRIVENFVENHLSTSDTCESPPDTECHVHLSTDDRWEGPRDTG